MSSTFEYCGYHFTPYRKFERRDGDNFKIMQRVRTDWELSLFTYDNRKADYTYEGFYAASTDKKCDLFRCEENGRIYVPCLNELFIYPEPKQRSRKPEQRPSAVGALDNAKKDVAATPPADKAGKTKKDPEL